MATYVSKEKPPILLWDFVRTLLCGHVTASRSSVRKFSTHSAVRSDSVVVMERWAEVAMGYGCGRVSHAAAGAMKVLLQDWYLMVTQLEHQLLTGHLTLQACPCS